MAVPCHPTWQTRPLQAKLLLLAWLWRLAMLLLMGLTQCQSAFTGVIRCCYTVGMIPAASVAEAFGYVCAGAVQLLEFLTVPKMTASSILAATSFAVHGESTFLFSATVSIEVPMTHMHSQSKFSWHHQAVCRHVVYIHHPRICRSWCSCLQWACGMTLSSSGRRQCCKPGLPIQHQPLLR